MSSVEFSLWVRGREVQAGRTPDEQPCLAIVFFGEDRTPVGERGVTKGCDLECGSVYKNLDKALDQGLLTDKDVDVALTRLMYARMKLGMFDPPERVRFAQIPYSVNESDEHDRLTANARRHRDGSWSLSGLLRPDEVEDLTEVELPDHEDYDTIAGLVLRVLGRVPEVGDLAEVPVPDRSDPDVPTERLAVLTVERMDGLRIDRLRLRVLDTPAGDGGEQ